MKFELERASSRRSWNEYRAAGSNPGVKWPRQLIVVITLWCTVAAAGPNAQKQDCEATVFVLQNLENGATVPSLDGRHRIVLRTNRPDAQRGSVSVYAGTRLLRTFQLQDLSAGLFVKWAPDSRAFYVMWSNGGMIGGYSVRAFRVGDLDVHELPLTSTAEREFRTRHPCPARGWNVFAVRWVDGSSRMLLAFQVYPVSDCGRQMGVYRGYLVAVDDGAIIRRYSERRLAAQWPDDCPSSIYPTAFWTAEDLEQALSVRRRPPRR